MATDSRLLIAGGDRDPNIRSLLGTLEEEGIPHDVVLTGSNRAPAICWDFASGALTLDGRALAPAAAFLRCDVFESMEDGRPQSGFRAHAWYSTVVGWLASQSDVRMLNRNSLGTVTNKPHVLHVARSVGLSVPATQVTNDLEGAMAFANGRPKVVKPVNGGGFCQTMESLVPRTETRGRIAAAPAIVQERLEQPEYRVYGIGGRLLSFRMISESLDYREKQDCRVEPTDAVPTPVLAAYSRLLEALDMDFAAADFKTCAETGELRFLEVNSSPMFAAFDHASDGSVSRAIAAALTDGAASRACSSASA